MIFDESENANRDYSGKSSKGGNNIGRILSDSPRVNEGIPGSSEQSTRSIFHLRSLSDLEHVQNTESFDEIRKADTDETAPKENQQLGVELDDKTAAPEPSLEDTQSFATETSSFRLLKADDIDTTLSPEVSFEMFPEGAASTSFTGTEGEGEAQEWEESGLVLEGNSEDESDPAQLPAPAPASASASASTSTSASPAAAETETETERVARELAESERLAYAMMQEEAERAYNMQMEFMRNNANILSEEDFAALTAVVNEGMVQEQAVAPAVAESMSAIEGGATATGAGPGTEGTVITALAAHEAEADAEADISGNSDTSNASSGWTDPNNYERLLHLANQLGDVKTERWKLRATSVIDGLPTIYYSQILALSQPPISSTTAQNDTKAIERTDDEVDAVTVGKKRDSDAQELEQHHRELTNNGVSQDCREEISFSQFKRRLSQRTVDSVCSVCMEPFKENSDENHGVDSGDADVLLTLLPCSHYAHGSCVRGWMAENNSCPVCLQEVSPSSTTS